MSATDPFKVTDLIHKYGWDFLAYMANLGVNLPGNAQVIFVDSNATNKSDADDAVHGHSFEYPVATLDYAVGLCTDGQGDVILIAPGHTENITTAAPLTVDISDLTIVGLGTGLNRPKFSIATNTTATVSVTAANVVLKNIQVVSAVADAAVGITVGASAHGFWMEDCYVSDGNDDELEMIKGISLTAECDDVTIKNCEFHTVTAGGCASAIYVAGGNDRLRIEGCDVYGYYSVACVDADQTTASLETIVRDNIFVNMGGGNVSVAWKADSTGVFVRNMYGALGETLLAGLTNQDLMLSFECYECDEDDKSGVICPGVCSG